MSFQDLLPSRIGEIRVPPPRQISNSDGSNNSNNNSNNNRNHTNDSPTRLVITIPPHRVSFSEPKNVSSKTSTLSPRSTSPLSPSNSSSWPTSAYPLVKRRSERSVVLHGKVHNYVTEDEDCSSTSLDSLCGELEQVVITTSSSSAERNNSTIHENSNSNYDKSSSSRHHRVRSHRDTRRHNISHRHNHQEQHRRSASIPPSYPHTNYDSDTSKTHVIVDFIHSSTFAQLSHEMMQFQKLVTDLEGMLEMSGESAEAAWRCRIIIRSAQETDNDLWRKLHLYENSLLFTEAATSPARNNNNGGGVGTGGGGSPVSSSQQRKRRAAAQSACAKLQRDFRRIHEGLLAALSGYEKRQNAEISRLGAVNWSTYQHKNNDDNKIDDNNNTTTMTATETATGGEAGEGYTQSPTRSSSTPEDANAMIQQQQQQRQQEVEIQQQQKEEVEDYFDRALRQAELEKMNQSMHTVHDIYKELATLVEIQQPQIDKVQENIEESKQYVEDAKDALMGGCSLMPIHLRNGGGDGGGDDSGGLCGSLERLGDPRDWNFPFESLDLVFKDDASICEADNVEINADNEAIEVERVVELKSTFEMNEEESACEMTCGTIKADLMTLHRDVIHFGKHVMYNGNQQLCGAVPIREL